MISAQRVAARAIPRCSAPMPTGNWHCTTGWWELGVHFTALELGGGQSVARAHRADPVALMARLGHALAEQQRAVMRPSTRAGRLLRRNGAVAGVATTAAEEFAAGAVVLATGGFSLAEDLLARFAPD